MFYGRSPQLNKFAYQLFLRFQVPHPRKSGQVKFIYILPFVRQGRKGNIKLGSSKRVCGADGHIKKIHGSEWTVLHTRWFDVTDQQAVRSYESVGALRDSLKYDGFLESSFVYDTFEKAYIANVKSMITGGTSAKLHELVQSFFENALHFELHAYSEPGKSMFAVKPGRTITVENNAVSGK
jgi:hypothetical protein